MVQGQKGKNKMEVHTDFTSGKHTLVFAEGKRVALTKQESVELEEWYEAKAAENQYVYVGYKGEAEQ